MSKKQSCHEAKNILRISAAKLTTLSVVLLLAVFCTIGMSFTPAEEGDIVAPNDTTALAGRPGPRKSHWNGGGCNESDSNNNDYARTSVVTMGHGIVSIKNTTKNGSLTSTTTKTSTNVAGNEAVITWNCNKSTSGHTNSFELTATPDEGYYFAGWSTSNTSNTASSTENPWTTTVTIPHGEKGTSQNSEWESSSNPYPTTYYGYFALITYVDVTFAPAPEGCSYDITVGGNTQTVTTSNVIKTHITEAKLSNPVASSGYVFAGWYQIDGSGNVVDITSASPTIKFSENVTLGARFLSTASLPKFKNITKNTEYYGLRLALVNASSGDKIIPVADCTVDGSDLVAGESYTIPAGVTLLIPFNADNTCYTTAPAEVAPAAGDPGPYRTLTLSDGVKINVEGSISVSAQQYSTNTSAGQHGVRGKYGFIYMYPGSEIILKSGANLYAWGYVSGDGEITAKDGSNVYEMFQITDFRGGNATSDFPGDSHKVFPFSQYYIQNIESVLHLEYGATETVNASIYVSSTKVPGAAKLIGKSGALFTMNSGCVLTKKYDRITDRMYYILNGNATLASLGLTFTGVPLIGTINLTTSSYVLPLNGNMTINVKENKTLTISQDLSVLPGAEVNIASGAKVILSSGNKVYIYDSAEWKSKGYVYSSVDIKQLAYVARNHLNAAGVPKTRTVDTNPKFVVDGGIEATGGFYTTASGADICSSGTGYFKFVTNAAPDNGNTYQAYQSGNSISSWPSIPVTSAQLHNADGSYTTTTGAPANTTINYKHGHWGWKVIWRLEDGTPMKTAYYYKQPDDTWIGNNKPAETHPDEGTSSCTYTFNGWNKTTTSANQEIEMVASFTRTCPNYYEVTWKSEDGSATLETDASVGEGEATRYNGDALTKATDWTAYYTYEFDGWTTLPNGAGDFYADGETPAATANATYYAHFKAIGMAASVTAGGNTTIYMTLPEAFNAANNKANATITVLHDIANLSDGLTYAPIYTPATCTLNLNNCTVHGACATLLEINASGSTFTITDNSTEKNGRLENIFSLNEKLYNVKLSAGTLNFDAGTIYVKNTAQYHSSNLKSCEARGIQVTAEQKLNMTGGRVESYATRNAYGVLGTGSAANKTELNISGGSIYAEAPCGAYGINSSGKLNFGGTAEVEAHLNTDIVNAAYAADNADNNLNKHQTCYAINMTASASATASSCYFGTLNVTGGTIKASSALSRNYNSTIFGIRVYYSVAGMGNRNYASTSGTNAQQACAIGSVKNATIIVENEAKDTYGIAVYGHYNSYNNKNSVFTIENTSVDVKAYAGAYGIYSIGAIDGTTGECVTGDVEVTNCTVKTETTTGATAYATWVWAGATTIYKDKQANYYGEYADASKMTINGGTYTAKTKTTSAYATGTTLRARSTYGYESSVEANRTEGGHAEKYPTLIINGGTFNATSTTYTARGVSSGGNTTIENATFNVVAGSYQAYGLYALAGKLTATNVVVNDTAKTRVSSSDNSGYAYGAVADCSISAGAGNGVQTGVGYSGEIELNNCTFNVATTTYPGARGINVNATSKLHNMAQFKADSLSNKWSTATYNAYYSQFPCKLQNKDSIWVGVAGKVTVNGGTINVKAQTTTAIGAVVSRAVHYSYHTPNTVLEQCPAVLNINGTSFDVSTGTSTTAEGVRTYGIVNISGDSYFNVHPATTTAIGLRIYAGTTTINDNPTFDVATGSSSATAYGAWVLGDTPADKTGLTYDGELIVNGGTFNVTTGTTTAYGVLVDAKARQITSTATGYYPGTYGSMGHATIKGGTFNVTAGTYGAFGVYVNRAITADNLQIFRGVADIYGGTFNVTAAANAKKSNNCDGVLSYGTTTINGGTFNVESKNETTAANGTYAYGVYVADGTTTINKNAEDATKPLFNVKAYGTIYSVLVTAGQANATTGLTDNGNVIINGGTYNDTTTNDASSYGVCVSQPAPRVIASGDYAGTYFSTASATINDGTFNIYSASTTAVGVYTGRNYTSANTKPNTFSNYTYGNATINGGTFNMSATTNAEGIRSHGTTVVNGGTFKPTGRTSTAYGLYVYAGTTTINNTYNPKFEVRAPSTAYGALVGAQPSKDLGLPYDGVLTINGGDFDIQTTSGATAYGVNIVANTRKITSTSSGYYQGQYASAGTATINDGTFYIKAVGKTASAVNMGAAVSLAASSDIYIAASATPTCTITGGKFKVFASSAASAVVSTPLAENMPISGGYYNINTNLAKYAVSPKQVITLNDQNVNYPEYTYKIGDGATITWKNGSTTLTSTPNLFELGIIPVYYGETPEKEEDAQYTYTFDGWTANAEGTGTVYIASTLPTVSADATYYAHYSKTSQTYSIALNPNGGTINSGDVTEYTYGTGATLPSDVTRTNYEFAGWFDNSELTGTAVTNISTTATGDKEFWAKWTLVAVDRVLDIVDWEVTGNKITGLTINANGLKTLGGSTDWKVRIGETEKDKDARAANRTLKFTGLSLSPGDALLIQMKAKGEGEVYAVESQHTYTVPYVYAASTTLPNVSGTVYVNQGTLTVDDNRTIANLYVAPGASVNITSGTLTVTGKLVLRTLPWASAAINGSFTAGQTFITRIGPDMSTRTGLSGTYEYKPANYYPFGLPVDCDIDDVTLSDNTTVTYGSAWLLKEYNEETRAQEGATGNNWDKVSATHGIKGGKGYLLYSNVKYYREFYFPITGELGTSVPVSCTTDNTKGAAHQGWNMICSPLLGSHTASPKPEQPTISLLDENGDYLQRMPSVINPALPFFYQATAAGTLAFGGTSEPRLAPRRVAADEESTQIQWMHIDLLNANGQGDETSIYSHPTRYEETYKTGIDVAKQSLTASRAIIYSSHAYGAMAFAGVSDEQMEEGIALTVYNPTEQELTFSLRNNAWLSRMAYVWLTDTETGTTIDLLDSDYTLTIPAGTTSGRFVLRGRFFMPMIPTDVDNVNGNEQEKARKLLINEKMYIQINGRLYDATGKIVKGK